MEIEDISIQEIPEASIDTTIIPTPKAVLPNNIGFPIIQMPGCVRARTLKNKNLVTSDPRGNFYVCDGNVPTLESMAVDWGVSTTVEPEQEETNEETPEIVPFILPKKSKRKKRKKVKEEDGKDNQDGNTDVGQQDLNTAQLKVLFDILKIVLENTNSDYDFSWADELFTQQYSNGVYSKNTYMEDTRKKTILNK